MASLNFDESIVLILFAQAGGSLTPSRADIVTFDASLQTDFGSMLQQIMTDEGLAIDIHSRSLVLGCRPHMPGNTSAVQIRNGCRYVIAAHQELMAIAPVSLVARGRVDAAVPQKKGASRLKGERLTKEASGSEKKKPPRKRHIQKRR